MKKKKEKLSKKVLIGLILTLLGISGFQQYKIYQKSAELEMLIFTQLLIEEALKQCLTRPKVTEQECMEFKPCVCK